MWMLRTWCSDSFGSSTLGPLFTKFCREVVKVLSVPQSPLFPPVATVQSSLGSHTHTLHPSWHPMLLWVLVYVTGTQHRGPCGQLQADVLGAALRVSAQQMYRSMKLCLTAVGAAFPPDDLVLLMHKKLCHTFSPRRIGDGSGAVNDHWALPFSSCQPCHGSRCDRSPGHSLPAPTLVRKELGSAL